MATGALPMPKSGATFIAGASADTAVAPACTASGNAHASRERRRRADRGPSGIAPEPERIDAGFEDRMNTTRHRCRHPADHDGHEHRGAAAFAEACAASRRSVSAASSRLPRRFTTCRPSYPPIAVAARVEGVVIIEATIGADGRVQDARVLRSVPLLDQAALDAVRQWAYTPTTLNGVPVPVVMTVTVRFQLQR